jgi:peptide/nickel transport system substrate-binding protein
MHSTTFRRLGVLAATACLVLTACGGGSDTGSGDNGKGSSAASGGPLIVGTTDKVTTIDPAGAYDLPSWTLIYNVFQNLVSIPAGGNTPEPDAAEKCDFSDPTTYTCTLKDGLKFSDGSDLTSEDVKFSMDRMVKIAEPAGPSSLLASMASVEAPDPKTVTFKLKAPDATFPYALTTGAGAIVPSDKYPADKLQPDSDSVGSGVYKVEKFDKTQQVVLKPNENYAGEHKLSNNQVIVQYYQQESALKTAIENKEVMVAYRSLSPTDVTDIQKNGESKGVKIVFGQGTEINYLVFQVNKAPFDNKAVRQAVAQLVDRDTIAQSIYNGTVDPLYSMVPAGLQSHIDAFKEQYGAPDPAKAKALLDAAGVKTPVEATLWYTPSRYGSTSADLYGELQRELNDSGLFKVDLKSAEYEQYKQQYPAGAYQAYQLGWFPDFPDADNYTSPFYSEGGGFLKNGYTNQKVIDLLAQERASTVAADREKAFEEIQKITAEDAPIVPLWQAKQVAAVRDGVEGVEKTFDPSFTFRFWLVKGTDK